MKPIDHELIFKTIDRLYPEGFPPRNIEGFMDCPMCGKKKGMRYWACYGGPQRPGEKFYQSHHRGVYCECFGPRSLVE